MVNVKTKKDALLLEGTVVDVLQGGKYKVQLPNNHLLIAHESGKIRMNRIRILQGDRVDVELSPYDLTKGRIVYRYK